MDPIHTSTSHFLEIHFNIILPSTPGSPKWSLSLRFPHQNPVCVYPLTHTCQCPTQLTLLNLITWTILGKEYGSLSTSLCRFFHSPIPSPPLGPNILLSTLFSHTLSLCSSLNVSDQVSHPYATCKIIGLYILIFKFLDSKLEDKRFSTKW